MPDRVPAWAAPARAPIPEPFTWLSAILRGIGIPVMAFLWWALAFLSWKHSGLPSMSEIWPPTLPVRFTDLEVAVFGPLGASVVVVAVFRSRLLALLSILLGFVASAGLTLTRGAGAEALVVNTTERRTMIVVCLVSALVGLAIGTVAIESLRRFGFLGLFAVFPVVSLIALIALSPRADHAWLTRSALVVLLVMIAWRRWRDVLLWPVFFALFYLLTLAMSAVGHGAQSLRRPGASGVGVGTLTQTMQDFARSAWRVTLGVDWALFWPAAAIAGLVVAGLHVWRRFSAADD